MCGCCEVRKGEEVEHIIAKANGGTNSLRNLIFSCRKCNELKGIKTLKEFGKLMKKDFSHLEPKKTPRDAAIVQSARTYMIKKLEEIAVVETFPAWETSYNRKDLGYEKQHYYDAMCIGRVPDRFEIKTKNVMVIQAIGRITITATGYFQMKYEGRIISVKYDKCKKLENNDGYKKWREWI